MGELCCRLSIVDPAPSAPRVRVETVPMPVSVPVDPRLRVAELLQGPLAYAAAVVLLRYRHSFRA